MTKSKPNQTHTKKLLLRILIPVITILVALGIYFFVDFEVVSDWFRSLSFQPSPAITQIVSDLDLTDRGELMLKASHPALENNPGFTERCGNSAENISILGCYVGGSIYIKNITDPDLAGIQQSTAAHELLHAAWSRLDEATRSYLAKDINIVYKKHQTALAERLQNYEKMRWDDELHSIIGTEITDVPEALARHYSEFFADRTKIIAYFNAYDSKFQVLRTESESLRTQITDRRASINADTATYESGVNQLNADIEDFRRRAENGSFTNRLDDFYREQSALQARSDNLTRLFNQINQNIRTVNDLIDRYNQNAAALTNLNESISTPNAPPSV